MTKMTSKCHQNDAQAKAHATLLATLAKPMVWSKRDGRLVRQTHTDVQGLE